MDNPTKPDKEKIISQGVVGKIEFVLSPPKPYIEIKASDVPTGIDSDRLAIEYYKYCNRLKD